MMNLMDWNECENKFIRNVEIDHERIRSIKSKALLRKKRADNTKPTRENISFIVEDYYETIKELLVALLLKNGLRSKNHQCLISYLYKKYPDMEFDVQIISQMSFFRNRLDYYGEDVPEEFYRKNKEDIPKIIDKLVRLIDK